MRLYFLDNIRIVLTANVVLFHLSLTYGTRSGWYYYETTDDPTTLAALTIFGAYGRAFILGVFFMISGYFTPGSFDHKGPGVFMKDRILRLGVPLAFFACLVRPVMIYTINFDTLGSRFSFPAYVLGCFAWAPGPLWFVEVLLVFSVVYALCRLPGGPPYLQPKTEDGAIPGTVSIVIFICALSLATYLIRIHYPPSRQIFHLRPGNYAQYVAMYILGIVSFRKGWVLKLTDGAGRLWVAVTSLAFVLYGAITFAAMKSGTLRSLTGGSGLRPLLGITFENILCVGMLISLIFIFRRNWNFQGRLTRMMASDAYMVFVLHAPIIVYSAYLAQPVLQSRPMTKFCLLSVVSLVLCFFISHYVRKIPGVSRIV